MPKHSKIRRHSIYFASVIALGLQGACSSNSPPPASCSNASNINNPECNKQINPVDPGAASTLGIKFKDSFFYDINTSSWSRITKDNLAGGTTGLTIPVYSSYLSIAQDVAIGRAGTAEQQFNNQASYSAQDFNQIPYIAIEAQIGVQYLYSYKKKDSTGAVVYEKIGEVPTAGGLAILPITNSSFDNNLYSPTSTVGTRFTNTVAFTTQKKNATGAQVYSVSFDTIFQFPNVDFNTVYSDEANRLNLQTRYSAYLNSTGSASNTDFGFVTLKQKADQAEQIPLDVKIVFQNPPKLKIYEEPFFEMPFDYQLYSTTGQFSPSRGFSFYYNPVELTSDLDFNMKMRLGGQDLTKNSAIEYQYSSFPGGTFLDLAFAFDFTQNPAYGSSGGDPNGKGLIFPLKPACNEITGSSFNPVQENIAKATSIKGNGYIAICDPVANKKVVMTSTQVAAMTNKPYDYANGLEVGSDSWYNYFSFLPRNDSKNELGHLFGLRTIRFSVEGCLQMYVKSPGETAYQLKTKSGANCGTGPGWSYFYAEKQSTVFDFVQDYRKIPGIQDLITNFATKNLQKTGDFKFNTEVLNGNTIRHLY